MVYMSSLLFVHTSDNFSLIHNNISNNNNNNAFSTQVLAEGFVRIFLLVHNVKEY